MTHMSIAERQRLQDIVDAARDNRARDVHVLVDTMLSLLEKADRLAAIERRVSEDTARLDKLERLGDPGAPWIARQSSQGRGYRLHQTTRGGAHPTARAAIDAAPEPGPEKNDEKQ